MPKHRNKRPDEVPQVYQEMLRDVATEEPGRSVKKRRVGDKPAMDEVDHVDKSIPGTTNSELRNAHDHGGSWSEEIARNDCEDSESEIAWEDVGADETANQALDLTLNVTEKRRRVGPKMLDGKEKKLRLDVHKMHLCCLLIHVCIRNHWCNDTTVQSTLRSTMTSKIYSYLNPRPDFSQFQRSRSFMDGISQISDSFRAKFCVSARGMAKAQWAQPGHELPTPPSDIDLPYLKEDFVAAASSQTGSRDIGAQLFCSLLRSAGLWVRLVCSLQPLPFRSTEQPLSERKYARIASKEYALISTGVHNDQTIMSSIFLLASRFDNLHPGQRLILARPIRESRYPVYWVEVLNPAVHKWIPVDPLVTKSIARASKFEPPWLERENKMTYVLAFENEGHVFDVTARYAKAYNAKTRRHRVEITKDGESWWTSLLARRSRSRDMEYDLVEEQELGKRFAQEAMPRSIQDFRGHPYYVLERHLKRNEIVWPRRSIGVVGIGHGHNYNSTEPVYRRQDVKVLHSTARWWRQGRLIKAEEVQNPLRCISSAKTDADEDQAGAGLYAAHQTEVYRPPAVENGTIAKNTFGNIDVYVPSMIPTGAVHIRHPQAATAARSIGADFALAVTGFTFRARRGLPVLDGVVLSQEHLAAMQIACENLMQAEKRKNDRDKSAALAALWLKLLRVLRIRRRIDGLDVEGDDQPETLTQEASTSPIPGPAHQVNVWSKVTIPQIAEKGITTDAMHVTFPAKVTDDQHLSHVEDDPPQDLEIDTTSKTSIPSRDVEEEKLESPKLESPKMEAAEEDLGLTTESDETNSLLSHDPAEDTEEPEWIQ